MSGRELVVLGTASQVPTRTRAHHSCFLRWDREGVLFDPGEGTQRQMLLAGVPASAITRICITHFHGDHCLGLPGVVQRCSLDGVTRPIPVHHPASGAEHLDRLRHASIFDDRTDLRPAPIDRQGPVAGGEGFTLVAAALDHRVDCWGYRLEEPDGHRLDAARLGELGIHGPAVGELVAAGSLRVGGRRVELAEVSLPRPGQVAAFVMDTRRCDGAAELAAGADLLVCEATFLDADAELADRYGHLTARQAATLARDAGARRLVLTHFSGRYPDLEPFLAEAAVVHPDVVVATEGARVAVPRRRAARAA